MHRAITVKDERERLCTVEIRMRLMVSIDDCLHDDGRDKALSITLGQLRSMADRVELGNLVSSV